MLYFLADTHFNHANIIKYSKRPFPDVESMNKFLLDNWIDTVKPEDTVIFVGDFAMGRYEHLLYKVVQKSNTIFIRGNHDKKLVLPYGNLNQSVNVASAGGTQFIVTHDPDEVSRDYRGWIIHGHHHNNFPDRYPFFNPDQKTINVSVDMIGFRPISMDEIMRVMHGGVWMTTRDEKP